jgi:hypothetical protein
MSHQHRSKRVAPSVSQHELRALNGSIEGEEVKMTRATKTMSAALVVLGVVAGVPGATRAATTHTLTFDGNMCQTDNANIKRSINGVYNISTTYGIPVYCPIPRDLTVGTSQQLFKVGANVYDRNPTSNLDVTCSLRGVDEDNGFISSFTSFKTTGSGTPMMRISGEISLITSSPLFLECVLPAASGTAVSHIQTYWLSYTLN